MTVPPVLRCVVSDLNLAMIALTVAREAGAVAELWSPPGGAQSLGVGYWAALDRAVRQGGAQHHTTTVLDCGDAAGLVLASFREGLPMVHYTGTEAVRSKLKAIAADGCAVLHSGPLPDLDLRSRLDPAASCRFALNGRVERDAKSAR